MTAAQQKLVEWADKLAQAGFFNKTINQLWWTIINALNFLAESTENLLNAVYDTFDFTQYPAVQTFLNSFRPFYWVLLAIALIFLGWQLIFNKEDSKPKTIQNIIIFIICVFALPNLINTMNTLTIQAYDWLSSGGNPTNSAAIVKGSLTDFMYVDKQGWTKTKQKNNLPANEKIFNINIAETISPESKGISSLGADITKQKMSIDSNGNYEFEDFKDDKILGITYNKADYYLRYKVDFLTVIISLLAVIIAVFFCAFKVGRLIFEIVIHQLLALLYAASDMTTGQRVKAVLKSLVSLYVVMFFSTVMIKLFYIYSNYISDTVDNGAVKSFLLIIAAFAVIDGPNVIEKTLGLDAGLSSAMQKLSSIYYTSMMTRGITHTAGAVINKGKQAAGKAGGFIWGVLHDNDKDTGIHTESSGTDTGINTGESSMDTGIHTSANNNNIMQNGTNSNTISTSDINANGINSNTINASSASNDIANTQSANAETARINGDIHNNNVGDNINNSPNNLTNNSASVYDNQNNSVSGNIRNDNLNNHYNIPTTIGSNPNSFTGKVRQGYNSGQKTRDFFTNGRKGKRGKK